MGHHYRHDTSPPPAKRSRAEEVDGHETDTLSRPRPSQPDEDVAMSPLGSDDHHHIIDARVGDDHHHPQHDYRSLSPSSRSSHSSTSESSAHASPPRLPPLPRDLLRPPSHRPEDRPIIRLPPLRIPGVHHHRRRGNLHLHPVAEEPTYTSTPPHVYESPLSSPPSHDEEVVDEKMALSEIEKAATYMAPSVPASPEQTRCELPPPDRRRSQSPSPPTILPPVRHLLPVTEPANPLPSARTPGVAHASLAYRYGTKVIQIAPQPSDGSPPQVPRANMERVAEKSYKCNICPKSFTRNYDLTRHRSSHQDARLHVCRHCGRSFNRRDALSRHNLIRGCAAAAAVNSSTRPTSSPQHDGFGPQQRPQAQQVHQMQTGGGEQRSMEGRASSGPTFKAIVV